MKRYIFKISLITIIAINIALSSNQRLCAQSETLNIDSLEYILPHFSMGNVFFETTERSTALININTFDQRLRFIDSKNDTLIVKNEDEIKNVYVQNRYFTKWQGIYLEVLYPRNDISIAVARHLKVLPKKSTGAYGQASETTSVSSITHINDGTGATYKLKRGSNNTYKYKEDLYLFNGKQAYYASKKSFLKCYSKFKKEIETYIKENHTDFSDYNSVLELYKYCQTL